MTSKRSLGTRRWGPEIPRFWSVSLPRDSQNQESSKSSNAIPVSSFVCVKGRTQCFQRFLIIRRAHLHTHGKAKLSYAPWKLRTRQQKFHFRDRLELSLHVSVNSTEGQVSCRLEPALLIWQNWPPFVCHPPNPQSTKTQKKSHMLKRIRMASRTFLTSSGYFQVEERRRCDPPGPAGDDPRVRKPDHPGRDEGRHRQLRVRRVQHRRGTREPDGASPGQRSVSNKYARIQRKGRAHPIYHVTT